MIFYAKKKQNRTTYIYNIMELCFNRHRRRASQCRMCFVTKVKMHAQRRVKERNAKSWITWKSFRYVECFASTRTIGELFRNETKNTSNSISAEPKQYYSLNMKAHGFNIFMVEKKRKSICMSSREKKFRLNLGKNKKKTTR